MSLPVPNSGQGLVFESPVFVNYNIHIPPENRPNFPNVTFADTVILGRGVLMQSGRPAQQPLNGGLDARLYTSASGFGGFLRGIKIDDQLDLGLNVLSGRTPGTPPDDTNFRSCIDRNRTKYDLTATRDSRLVAMTRADGNFKLSWTEDNFFQPQNINDGIDQTNGNFHRNPSYNATGRDRPLLRIEVRFDSGQRVAAKMAADANLRIQPNAGSRAVNPPGELVIQTRSVSVNGRDQDNQVDLNVIISNENNFLTGFEIEVLGYDVGFSRGNNFRRSSDRGAWSNRLGPIRYSNAAAPPAFIGRVSVTSPPPASFPAGVNADWQRAEELCDPARGAGDAFAFMPSRWDLSFAPSTRFSWNVRPASDNPAANNVVFNALNSTASSTVSPTFITYSIANTCTIAGDATFVTTMIVCDRFVIEPRSRPLRIVGTVIATQVQIDPSAVTAGITWSSIYNADAVVHLRQAGVLKSTYAPNQPSCDPIAANPIWHPSATLEMRDDRYHCSPISLRDKLDPFRWTNVDPDCGLISGAVATTCKNRPLRYVIKEISKVFSL